MTDSTKVFAPFTQEQVRHLNEFQRSGAMHPFTCVNHSDRNLVATEGGWRCPGKVTSVPAVGMVTVDCDYTQNWAHAFMADGSFLKQHRQAFDELLAAKEDAEEEARLRRIRDVLNPGRRPEDISAMQQALDEVKRLERVQYNSDDALALQMASDDALKIALKRWPEINR